MAAKFVILLSCFVSGIVAGPPATSYLPPGGPVVGRPAPVPAPRPIPVPAPAPITAPITLPPISRPSPTYLPPSGHGVGSRPIAQGPVISRPVVSAPIVRPPVSTVPAPRPISLVGHGHGHGHGHGPVVSPPIVHRPAPVPRPSVPVNTSPVRPGYYGGSHGSRTVGATAPY